LQQKKIRVSATVVKVGQLIFSTSCRDMAANDWLSGSFNRVRPVVWLSRLP